MVLIYNGHGNWKIFSKWGKSLDGPLPGGPRPIPSSNFDKSMPLLCYAFYLYAQSIKASNHYAFQVKALFCLCLYSNSPDSKVYFTVEPIFFQHK